MTRERLLVQMRLNHAIDSSKLGMTIIGTTVESYDLLIRGVMLYSMGFQMDYWMKITTY